MLDCGHDRWINRHSKVILPLICDTYPALLDNLYTFLRLMRCSVSMMLEQSWIKRLKELFAQKHSSYQNREYFLVSAVKYWTIFLAFRNRMWRLAGARQAIPVARLSGNEKERPEKQRRYSEKKRGRRRGRGRKNEKDKNLTYQAWKRGIIEYGKK